MRVFRHSVFSVPVQIVCYDNGGNHAIHEFVRDNKQYTWIGDGTNIGLNAALNKCFEHAKYDYLYLPHTDMFLMPGWDSALLRHAKRYAPTSYLFCSRSIEPTRGHTNFHHIANYGQEPQEFQREQLLADFAEHNDSSVTTGYRMPFFLHKALWDKMQGVDPNLFSYATDDDLFFSAYHNNVRRFWMVNQSLVYHLQGKSNKQQNVDRNSQKPYDYLFAKWSALGYDMSGGLDASMRRLILWYHQVQ